MDDEDFNHLDDTSRAFLKEPMKTSSYLLYAIMAFITIMLIWAYFGKLDERTTAIGKVIPSTHVQDIQNLEGGILAKIPVKEGDLVKKGEVVIYLDPIRFRSAYQEALVKYHALLAALARLKAESTDKKTIHFPPILREKYPQFVANQEQLFKANRATHRANIETLEKAFVIHQEQIDISKPLAEEGIISRLEFLKFQQQMNESKGKIAIAEQSYKADTNKELSEVKSEIDSLQKNLEGLKDRMTRTTMASPVNGIVKKIYVDTVGAVINPGQVIMEIVPADDVLLIEAKIPPEKIAFIHPGQKADVKITAYDPYIYGSLTGTVKHISADAIMESVETEDDEEQDAAFYKVIIQTDETYIEHNGEKLQIIPGMQVTADILTGEKTVLEYIMKPILRAKQNALKER